MRTEYKIEVYNKILKKYQSVHATCPSIERARIQANKSYYTNHGKVRIIKVTYEVVK